MIYKYINTENGRMHKKYMPITVTVSMAPPLKVRLPSPGQPATSPTGTYLGQPDTFEFELEFESVSLQRACSINNWNFIHWNFIHACMHIYIHSYIHVRPLGETKSIVCLINYIRYFVLR